MSSTETAKNDVSDEKCEKPNNDGLCFGVTVENAGNGGGETTSLPVCVHCGSADPAPNRVAFDGCDLWLHPGCEGEYLDKADAAGHGPIEDDGLDIPDYLDRTRGNGPSTWR